MRNIAEMSGQFHSRLITQRGIALVEFLASSGDFRKSQQSPEPQSIGDLSDSRLSTTDQPGIRSVLTEKGRDGLCIEGRMSNECAEDIGECGLTFESTRQPPRSLDRTGLTVGLAVNANLFPAESSETAGDKVSTV